MRIIFLNRNIEIKNFRLNIDGFKHEKTLIGFSQPLKNMTFKDLKIVIMYLFMPYSWLNRAFEENRI